jgi:drug/metabolite transporter (DMT)-like permease
MVGGMVVHGMLLGADYTALAGKLFRTPEDSQQYFPLMILAHVILSAAFVWIYARGHEPARPWLGQGLRFGIAVALLTVVPTYIIYFCVQPTPANLVVKQIVFDGAWMILLGILVAWWYRGRATAP